MESILLELLRRLEAIVDSHPELNSPEVRTTMDYAILRGFLHAEVGYLLPQQFGMRSDEGNRMLREALERFINAASKLSLDTHIERVVAFTNEGVATKHLNRIADFFAPFTTWLAKVAERPLVVAPNDLAAEAVGNFVGVSRDDGLAVAPSIEQVESFLRAAVAVRRDQLATTGSGDAVSYYWYDASTACFYLGVVSLSHGRLPFDLPVVELTEPTEIARSFVCADRRDPSQITSLPMWVVKLPGNSAEPVAPADGGRDAELHR